MRIIKKLRFWKIYNRVLFFLFGAGIISGILTCATISSADFNEIKKHPVYQRLDDEDRARAEMILDKIHESENKKYYLERFKLLLETPTEVSNKKNYERNTIRIKESVATAKEIIKDLPPETAEAYLTLEEKSELDRECKWENYQPDEDDAFFYVCKDDPNDLKVRIKVNLTGSKEYVDKILLLEDSIEKHLGIPGFSVNLIFVDYKGPDVFTVTTEPKIWVTDHNWSGSYQAMAHELLHLMGLSDEYDGIKNHSSNKSFTVKTRLWYFWKQLFLPVYADASDGIMDNHYRKPLERHACSAVGLPINQCVSDRQVTAEMKIIYATSE